MSIRALICTATLAAAAVLAAPALAQEPTLHDVYQAVESGHMSEAQRMMDEVLRAHPGSAKAHYVEAELLAKQGRPSEAQAELSTAERLDPGLAFAKPEAVRELKARIASPGGHNQSVMPALAPTAGGIPWGMLLLGAAVIALIVVGIRAMRRQNAPLVPATGVPAYGQNPPMQPGTGTPGAVGPAGGGMGSAILGGLATGAAVGAGVVAGEALAHHFMGEHQAGGNVPPHTGDEQRSPPDDMGGADFGVNDSSSWDDGLGGGGGGGDWT